jgi:rSAM/selenodomain-associated transferase 2
MAVSVIIPTFNEAACLPVTLCALRSLGPLEIIVADGGSTDGTRAAAAAADRFLEAPAGRARQMNFGAAQARGTTLLFLHADCTLDMGALEAAESCLGRRGVVAACFQQSVGAKGVLYRSIDACATYRVRLTGLAYGDQGLILHRDTFAKAGGFPNVRLLEDVLLCRNLQRLGRIVVAPRKIFVSPRRWQRAGIVRQTLRNWTLTALAAAGVPPDRLARYYPVVR